MFFFDPAPPCAKPSASCRSVPWSIRVVAVVFKEGVVLWSDDPYNAIVVDQTENVDG